MTAFYLQVKPRRSGLGLWAGDGAFHSGREGGGEANLAKKWKTSRARGVCRWRCPVGGGCLGLEPRREGVRSVTQIWLLELTAG